MYFSAGENDSESAGSRFGIETIPVDLALRVRLPCVEFRKWRAAGVVPGVPSRYAPRDDRPFVAVNRVRGEDLLVLLLSERPSFHRGVELVAPPVWSRVRWKE